MRSVCLVVVITFAWSDAGEMCGALRDDVVRDAMMAASALCEGQAHFARCECVLRTMNALYKMRARSLKCKCAMRICAAVQRCECEARCECAADTSVRKSISAWKAASTRAVEAPASMHAVEAPVGLMRIRPFGLLTHSCGMSNEGLRDVCTLRHGREL